MAIPIGGITPGGISPQHKNIGGEQQHQAGKSSFEKVLQGGNRAEQNASAANQPNTISPAHMEQMRVDLSQRLNRLPPGSPTSSVLAPEMIDTRTRMGLLKEAMGGVNSTPAGTDLKGRFAQVEGEWSQLEQAMGASKDMSQGELLGLQARLYQVSQHVDVMSKVVDQVTGGIKTILNTNV